MVSRTAAAPLLATLLALAAIVPPGPPAWAQSSDAAPVGPPVVLTPPGGQGDAAPSAPTPAPVIERAPAGIEVDPLGEIATDYGGTLEPGAGGFPVDMWRGSDRGFVERLLPQLPVVPGSPVLRDLARRLLLSSAAAPAGSPRVNLLAVRADRLIALGDRAGAAELLRLVPEAKHSAATERILLEASWLAGDDDRACTDVDDLIRRFDQDLYLQKALIFCQARAGQVDEATLGLDLLREQGHADDETFFELVGVLTGLRETAKVETLGEPKGLNYALLRAAGQALPEDAAAAGDPDLLALRLSAADAAGRLAATEQAAAAGIVPPEALAQAYRAEPAQPEELAGAADIVPDTPHARAVLYQAARQAADPATRAGLIRKALAAARQDGSYLATLPIYLPLVEQLTPSPALAAAAGEAGRALYVGGRYEQAGAWLELARAEAGHDPDAAAALLMLQILARIAGAEPAGWDARTAAAWGQSLDSAGAGDPGAVRLFAVLDGLGRPAGAAWPVLADPAAEPAQPMPDPALWFALGDAAAARRLGETVMLSLFVLGPDGPGGAHPVALAQALAALRQVGLEAEARALAFEAALASGA